MFQIQGFLAVLVLGTVSGITAFTISKTEIFSPFRDWVGRRSDFWGSGLNCPYCTGHWTALFFTAIYRPVVFQQTAWADLIVSWFLVTYVAMVAQGLMVRAVWVIYGDDDEHDEHEH